MRKSWREYQLEENQSRFADHGGFGMSLFYIYTPDGEFKEEHHDNWIYAAEAQVDGTWLLSSSEKILKFRYGMVKKRQWQNTLFGYFPPEFKAHLLLLGVQ